MTDAKPYNIPRKLVWKAYQLVKANRGASGVDKVTLAAFEKDLKDNLYKIWNRMSSGSYFPRPVRLVEIPKASGGVRPLGIPTVADRVAQTVVKLLLEPAVDPVFHPDSYGYRPGKSAHDAVRTARQRCWEYDWVIELDIKGFFDAMPHEHIEKALSRHTEESWVALYVGRWLRAPLQRPDGAVEQRTKGTPQGGVISPLLANLFLHYAFDMWMQRHQPTTPFERYADDVVVHCRSAAEAQSVLAAIRERLEQCGLELHPTKTRIVYCKDYRRPGDSEHVMFDFLGHTFRARPVRGRNGTVFYGFNPAISGSAAKRIRERIRSWHLGSRTQVQLQALLPTIDRVVRGWHNYYGVFFPSVCRGVLQAVNTALIRWALRKYKRFRRSWCAAADWLHRIATSHPAQFALWGLRVIPRAGRVRAV